MILVVLLDAGPLSLATNPKGSDESRRCKAWLAELFAAGVRIMVPEGADYEVRRELIRWVAVVERSDTSGEPGQRSRP
ncbi:MAG: hypothetical protein ACLP53_01760 [Isosphaeraceae bacterium]